MFMQIYTQMSTKRKLRFFNTTGPCKPEDHYMLPLPCMPETHPGSMLDTILGHWTEMVAPKPLIVLFDEVDVLQDETMISFLRQLRGGFTSRGMING